MFILMMEFENDVEKCKFEEIYHTYINNLFCICKSYLKEEGDAEDALQVSLMKIIGVMDKIEDIHSKEAQGLMGTIVRNTAIDFCRKKKKLPMPVEEIPERVDYTSLDEGIIDQDKYRVIIETINGMPDKYKEILRFRCLYHFTVSETAKSLNISENNVYARLNRAKNILLQRLKEDCHE